jgi:hypothetical protein
MGTRLISCFNITPEKNEAKTLQPKKILKPKKRKESLLEKQGHIETKRKQLHTDLNVHGNSLSNCL